MNKSLTLLRQQTGLILSQKTEKAFQSLEPAEQKIVFLALGKKLNELEPVKVIERFMTMITAAYAIAGQKQEHETVLLYAEELHSRVSEKYPGMTIEEINTAIHNGIYGDYSEYYGINPKSLMQFIQAYRFNKDRVKAINKFLDAEADQEHYKELTPEQKEQSKKDFCNTLYADYLAGKLITDFIPGFIYDFLEEKELIRLSFQEKKAIQERAKAYHLRLSASPKIKESIGERLKGTAYQLDPDKSLKTISKQFAVFEYFEKMNKARQTKIFGDGD